MDDNKKKSIAVGAAGTAAHVLSEPMFDLAVRFRKHRAGMRHVPKEFAARFLQRIPYALVTGAVTGLAAHAINKPMQKESSMNMPIFYGFNDELMKLASKTTVLTSDRLEKIAAMPPWLKGKKGEKDEKGKKGDKKEEKGEKKECPKCHKVKCECKEC